MDFDVHSNPLAFYDSLTIRNTMTIIFTAFLTIFQKVYTLPSCEKFIFTGNKFLPEIHSYLNSVLIFILF